MDQKLLMPGNHITQVNLNTLAGDGCHIEKDNMFASIAGYLQIHKITDKDGAVKQQYSIQKSNKISAPVLKLGSIIIGRIVRIREDVANVKILMIDDITTKQNLEGVIRKQNIRESEIDKIQMEKTFIPGDIVKAKLVSYGDSSKLFLSTTGDDFGVLFAKNQDTRIIFQNINISEKLMLPYNWQEMICISSGLKEYRKVAKPNFNFFQAE